MRWELKNTEIAESKNWLHAKVINDLIIFVFKSAKSADTTVGIILRTEAELHMGTTGAGYGSTRPYSGGVAEGPPAVFDRKHAIVIQSKDDRSRNVIYVGTWQWRSNLRFR